MQFLKRYRWYWGMPLILLAAAGAYLGLLNLSGNFHEVVPGELYRSAQLDPAHLNRMLERHDIKTVLNLRGQNTGSEWYDNEIRVTQAAGVKHIDFRMSSSRELTPQRADELLAIMRDAPKPLLIHCRAGADRTGLASAMYLAAIAKQSEFAAEMQLWPIYGHLALYYNGAMAMNRSFETFEEHLGFGES